MLAKIKILNMPKIDFTDTSFLIPVRIDTESRSQNLAIAVSYLSIHFNTNIIVYEADVVSKIPDQIKQQTTYTFIKDANPEFHRTLINNLMIKACTTKYAVLYDIDIIICPTQLIATSNQLRCGQHHFAYPYDGRFVLVDEYNKKAFAQNIAIDSLQASLPIFMVNTKNSVGGCFMMDVAMYKKCGLENENITGWGHDDAERFKRIEKLGYPIYRATGPLFHLYHGRSENSYFFDEAKAANSFAVYFNTCAITKKQLETAIEGWAWA